MLWNVSVFIGMCVTEQSFIYLFLFTFYEASAQKIKRSSYIFVSGASVGIRRATDSGYSQSQRIGCI